MKPYLNNTRIVYAVKIVTSLLCYNVFCVCLFLLAWSKWTIIFLNVPEEAEGLFIVLNTTLDDEIGCIRQAVIQIAICNLAERFPNGVFLCVYSL